MVQLRQNDVRYTIQQVRRLPWVDTDNIYLVGHSEGGILAATFREPDAPITARIVESWTCHGGWSEYTGINAPDSEPVLTLLADNDPWFKTPWTSGNCEKHLNLENGSLSVIFNQSHIRNHHHLLEHEEVQAVVLAFLRKHRR